MRRRAPFVVLAFVATLFAACSQILGDVGNEPIDGGDASAFGGGTAADAGAQDVSTDWAVDGPFDAIGASDVEAGDDTLVDRYGGDATVHEVMVADTGCSAGQTRCDETGAVQQVCQADGGWEDRPCAAFCAGGTCATPPSCSGATQTLACGPSRGQNCCAARTVPGGTFYRSYDGLTDNGKKYGKDYPATISTFTLDVFEVTVSRFRNFVSAYDIWMKPAAGDGRNPSDPSDEGWEAAWQTRLPATSSDLKAQVSCSKYGYTGTWTASAGASESFPITCVDWFTAFAFCVWDHGRLATEAEWNFAAAAGAEQRVYPWSSPPTDQTIESSYAVYGADLAPVGSSINGHGKWGHIDLAGNAEEWVRDWYADPYPSPTCVNCTNLNASEFAVLRGGSFLYASDQMSTSFRDYAPPNVQPTYPDSGIRCARSY